MGDTVYFLRRARTRGTNVTPQVVRTIAGGLRQTPFTDSTAWRDYLQRSAGPSLHCTPPTRAVTVIVPAERDVAAAMVSPDTIELDAESTRPLGGQVPEPRWVLAASAVGLSANGRKAVVMVESFQNGLAGDGSYIALEGDTLGRWYVRKIVGLYIR